MNLFERLSRYLQAPADGGAGGSGGGGEGGGGAGGAGAGAGDKGGAGGGAGAGDGKGGGDGKPKDGAGAKGAGDGKGGTGDDAGSGAGKAGEAGKPAAGEYVVKVPEGAQVDKARLDAFTQEAKAAGITAEQASKLVAYEVAQEKGRAESWAKQGDAWHGQLEKDPEFGGSPEKVKESEASLQKALKRFDTGGELAKDLEKYGIDNLPSLAKFLARIGRADGEDTGLLETTKADPNAKLSPTERRSRFYTDMQPKK